MSHIDASTKRDTILQFQDRFARSSTGCHVVAAVIMVGLSVSIAWVWKNNHLFSGDRIHTPEQIEQATNLISNSTAIRSRHGILSRESTEYQLVSREIKTWLPAVFDWDKAESNVQQLATESGVYLVDLERNKEYVGARVAVHAATCQVSGSFEEVCRFLHGLAHGEAPVWCDGIVMERTSLRSDGVSECDATLTLRFPVRGEQTIAGKLASIGDLNAT